MRLIDEFNNLQTREEKRSFALNHITDEKSKDILLFEKISEFTITALFYKSQGETYTVKRNYQATFQDKKQY